MKRKFNIPLIIVILFTFCGLVPWIFILSYRIQRIENKLGGPKKIAHNEKDTIDKVRLSVVRIIGGESEGSGFAIKKNGFILTNFHVIDAEPAPKVVLPDNTFETGKVIMTDEDADLAVIKIKKDLPMLRLAKINCLFPAEELLAIGYPLGGELSGESFVIRGSFSRSAEDRENNISYILTDMTMVSGISGGPMVNICGEVVGINTSGLLLGGMGIAISSDSILNRCQKMSESKDPLKGARKITFEPNKDPLEAVRCFYNYLKARNMEKAFELLSDNFIKGYSFDHWAEGYRPMLDTSIIMIKREKKIANRICVKLSTKDLIGDEIVYKYFEGYWDVRQIDEKWLLWAPRIKEVENPEEEWFLDKERINEINEFLKERNEDLGKYKYDMYNIAKEPGNEDLSPEELYNKATAPHNPQF
ncbi:MAG: trypsin-like peptidase domain-containing protein [Candidatus Omnitrophota bacterium]|nr:trypsin-like peptidase domain-containing protein [Candidatus Omnitrophota bacterium]